MAAPPPPNCCHPPRSKPMPPITGEGWMTWRAATPNPTPTPRDALVSLWAKQKSQWPPSCSLPGGPGHGNRGPRRADAKGLTGKRGSAQESRSRPGGGPGPGRLGLETPTWTPETPRNRPSPRAERRRTNGTRPGARTACVAWCGGGSRRLGVGGLGGGGRGGGENLWRAHTCTRKRKRTQTRTHARAHLVELALEVLMQQSIRLIQHLRARALRAGKAGAIKRAKKQLPGRYGGGSDSNVAYLHAVPCGRGGGLSPMPRRGRRANEVGSRCGQVHVSRGWGFGSSV